jgi:hypothetical protein
VLGVVLGGAVGHLDVQAAGAAQQQRQRVVGGDEVGVEGEAQQPQPALEVVLPERRAPLEEVLGAPDVVDEHVEAAVVGVDALDEPRHLVGVQVVDRDGDALAAGRGDQLGGLLDRLRAVDLGAPLARAAARRVDGRARLAQRHRDAAAGAPRRAGDERDLAREWPAHGVILPCATVDEIVRATPS